MKITAVAGSETCYSCASGAVAAAAISGIAKSDRPNRVMSFFVKPLGCRLFVRKLLMIVLAAVLVVRGIHCLRVEAELCACAKAAHSQSPPLADPSDADPNETGCLCKGALVTTAACPAGELRPQAGFGWLVVAGTSSSFNALALAGDDRAPSERMPSPLSGRTLRALRACWQI